MPNIRPLRDIAPGTSLLPMPIILSLFACLLFAATLAIDLAAFRGALALPDWLSVGNVDDARALLGAIIGAVSTVLALIFSVSLLVFSAAATQFGPRLMQRFLRDRMMQFTLGLFVATFFHALFTFIAVRQQAAIQFVPQLTVITTCAMVVFSFLSLVVFNDSIASSIQTNNVLPGILDDLRDAIRQVSEARAQQVKRTNGVRKLPAAFGLPEIAESQKLSARDGAVVLSTASGFVQVIQYGQLASEALRVNAVISLLFRAGQFVEAGEVIARILPAHCVDVIAPTVVRAVQLGRHRNFDQDLEFAITQLVEIALRALSPAINDTYTGLYCIDWLGEGIRRLATMPEPNGVWCSEDGEARVLFPPLEFREVVKTAFDLLRQASTGNPVVKIRLLQTWTKLAPHLSTPMQRHALLEQATAVREAAGQEAMAGIDRRDIEAAFAQAAGLLSV
jgi:uncharacterized membrane protein